MSHLKGPVGMEIIIAESVAFEIGKKALSIDI